MYKFKAFTSQQFLDYLQIDVWEKHEAFGVFIVILLYNNYENVNDLTVQAEN
jgi:hypothetical protein